MTGKVRLFGWTLLTLKVSQVQVN